MLSGILKKHSKYLRFLPQNLTFLYSGIFWEMHVLLLFVYIWAMPYHVYDVHIINISNGYITNYHVRDIIPIIGTQ